MDEQGRYGQVRIAAIDIGSNTTRLMIADVTVSNELTHHKIVLRESRITRLAEGVDARRMLLPAPVARTRNALTEFKQLAREHGAVYMLATATSAVRDADNGEAFLGEIEYTHGFDTRLLSGADEASWTWRGVTSDPQLAREASSGNGLLLDIGGGSTELVLVDHGSITTHDSLQLGSVRLTEQVLASPSADGSWTSDQITAATSRARDIVSTRFTSLPTPDIAIGVAGTVTTVSAIVHEMHTYDSARIHRSTITRDDVLSVRDRLAACSRTSREQIPGLEPRRAEVIVGGLCILAAVFDHAGIATMTVSESDILDGIALFAGEHAVLNDIDELPEPFGRTSC